MGEKGIRRTQTRILSSTKQASLQRCIWDRTEVVDRMVVSKKGWTREQKGGGGRTRTERRGFRERWLEWLFKRSFVKSVRERTGGPSNGNEEKVEGG